MILQAIWAVEDQLGLGLIKDESRLGWQLDAMCLQKLHYFCFLQRAPLCQKQNQQTPLVDGDGHEEAMTLC